MTENVPARCWLWITRREFYEAEDGSEPEGLRLGRQDGWWSCGKETRRGDLALLWRTHPRSDLGYLIRAETDALPLHKDRFAQTRGWRFGCEYRVVHRFRRPLTYQDLGEDPWLAKEWSAARRGGLQGLVKSIPDRVWRHLCVLFRDREGAPFLRALRRASIAPRLALWNSDTRLGRQLVCPESGGRIDLLFTTPGNRTYLVVELKVVRATSATFGQICSYMGWVRRHLAKGKRVIGLVVATDMDAGFSYCLRTNPEVQFLSLEDLGYAEGGHGS